MMKQVYPPRFPLLRKRGLRVTLLVMVLVSLLAVGSFTHVPTAHAFWNPTQLAFETWANSVFIDGPNQDGVQTQQCFPTPAVPPDLSYDTGWWWHGTTSISYYTNSSCQGWYYDAITVDAWGGWCDCYMIIHH